MESPLPMENVDELLILLDEVEQDIHSGTISLNSQKSIRLAKRLREVADLVDKKLNALEISDDESQGNERQSTSMQPKVKREISAQEQVLEEGSSVESTEVVHIKGEGPAPSPPLISPPIQQPQLRHTSSAPLPGIAGPAVQQQQLPQQQERPSMYKRFSNTRPREPDEITKKRRIEAEKMVRKLERPQTFSCGISYNGDQREKDFSDGIKEDLKYHLPALKTHRHLFHYMAWATTERLECDHCRKCTNTFS